MLSGLMVTAAQAPARGIVLKTAAAGARAH